MPLTIAQGMRLALPLLALMQAMGCDGQAKPQNTFARASIPDAPASPIVHAKATYPASLPRRPNMPDGLVNLQCDVETTGDADNCTITKLEGDVAFINAALAAVRTARFHPAMRNGVAVVGKWGYRFQFQMPNFMILAQFGTRFSAIAGDPRLSRHVELACDIGITGKPANCSVYDSNGPATMKAAALSYMNHAVLIPGQVNGYPLAETQAYFILNFFGSSNVPSHAEVVPLGWNPGTATANCLIGPKGALVSCQMDSDNSDAAVIDRARHALEGGSVPFNRFGQDELAQTPQSLTIVVDFNDPSHQMAVAIHPSIASPAVVIQDTRKVLTVRSRDSHQEQ